MTLTAAATFQLRSLRWVRLVSNHQNYLVLKKLKYLKIIVFVHLLKSLQISNISCGY